MMKTFIDIDEFKRFLNLKNLRIDTRTRKVMTFNKDSLTIAAEQDHKDNFTVKFALKFEHTKIFKEGLLQKEFSIEHHPSGESRHEEPHVQIHIHGPLTPNKVGKVWINLNLEKEEDYIICIKGFFYLLGDVIGKLDCGLRKQILNMNEIQKLEKQRTFLISRIKQCLQNKQIEYKDSEGHALILNPGNLKKLLEKDISLIPFFPEYEKK